MQITVKDLVHTFLAKTPYELNAIDNINVTIKQGEFVGVIGQTGSGKTTFIEHLNALLLPSAGSVEWVFENDKINHKTGEKEKIMESFVIKPTRRKKVKKAKDLRKRVGVVFQFAEYQLFEETIEKDIAFGPRSFGVSKSEALERAAKYIKLVGLDESFLKRSPFELSGGQKRRVALAGILAMEPDFIIADEPTAGLDPVGVIEILNIFKELHKQGKTVIIVTHDLDNVLEYTERVLAFKDGQIVKDGDTHDVLRDTEFLKNNYMEPPKLLDFVSKLEAKGIKVPKVTSIDELASFINKYMNKTKGGVKDEQ
ncbi:energy-coupling factor transporter ATPase [Mycoplasmopsis agalactiae]|uniref:Energy-coupling factor transporter ATP-binding protein EcfA2 n=1 Tax=Mycoplasmopsis agalactiae TaxID=2110 RepID=D3VR29_MYCAA|nr:energy-coupling factor transporter ATPase [Mycoplasmopsis agalactiae]KAB6718244.1 energy-coupling factor transporter ATPase [Mycoplasmopsis agalactiae]CBH40776.1 ABC transporter ATP binding protein [Mycoplasmopsis agalactiae]